MGGRSFDRGRRKPAILVVAGAQHALRAERRRGVEGGQKKTAPGRAELSLKRPFPTMPFGNIPAPWPPARGTVTHHTGKHPSQATHSAWGVYTAAKPDGVVNAMPLYLEDLVDIDTADLFVEIAIRHELDTAHAFT